MKPYGEIDVVVPVRAGGAITLLALQSLFQQKFVILRLYVSEGPNTDVCNGRVDAICQSRNKAKQKGFSNFVLLLDDDMIVPPDSIYLLYEDLISNPNKAAVAIDPFDFDNGKRPSYHVSQSIILWRRSVLEKIEYHTLPGKCECICATEDARKMGYEVDYFEGLKSVHLRNLLPFPQPM